MESMTFIKKTVSLLLTVCLLPISGGNAQAQMLGSLQEVQILRGEIQSIPVNNLKRVSITDPDIADITDANEKEISLIGQEPGQTVLFYWDEGGKQTVVIRVVAEDLMLVKLRLEKIFAKTGLKGVSADVSKSEGKVVLTGSISEDKLDTLNDLIDPFFESVLNLVNLDMIEDLIQLDMQITELSSSLSREMGVDWSTGTQTVDETTGNVKTTFTPGNGVSQVVGEIMPRSTGSIEDMFKIGKFYRSLDTALVAKVNALIEEGKGQILSKPRLVVKNAKEATFLVGGEIPVRTTTTSSSGGSSQENVEFKEYGVSMSVTPTIRDGMIDITLNVEISDVDDARSSGSNVAFITRSAQTQLLLNDRQTIVLAGLIKKRDGEKVSRVPFLGKIPVIGLLFRNVKTPSEVGETEMVISITPTIIPSLKQTEKEVFVPAKVAPVAAVKGDHKTDKVIPAIAPKAVEPKASEPKAKELPVISKNAAMTQALTGNADLKPYAETVQQKISTSIAYPYEAQQNNWQGTVKLALVIRKDGSLQKVFVKESSGYDVFDQDAVNTAQILAPFEPFTPNIVQDEITLTLPIVYNIDSFLKNVAKRQ